MNIEKLTHANLEQLHYFLTRNDFRAENFYPHPFTLDYLVWLLVRRTKDFYCVMRDGEKVISYGMLRGFEEGFEIPSLGVSVDKDYRGKGVGRFMCNYLHFVAKLKGCTKVRLRVNKDNATAKTLYESLGYVFRDFDEEYLEGFIDL